MYIIYVVIILAVMAVDYLSYSVDKRDHDLDPRLVEERKTVRKQQGLRFSAHKKNFI